MKECIIFILVVGVIITGISDLFQGPIAIEDLDNYIKKLNLTSNDIIIYDDNYLRVYLLDSGYYDHTDNDGFWSLSQKFDRSVKLFFLPKITQPINIEMRKKDDTLEERETFTIGFQYSYKYEGEEDNKEIKVKALDVITDSSILYTDIYNYQTSNLELSFSYSFTYGKSLKKDSGTIYVDSVYNCKDLVCLNEVERDEKAALIYSQVLNPDQVYDAGDFVSDLGTVFLGITALIGWGFVSILSNVGFIFII